MILVLVQPNEAVSMKDHAGNLVIDDEEGYDIKRDQVEAALVHLGLTGDSCGVFQCDVGQASTYSGSDPGIGRPYS